MSHIVSKRLVSILDLDPSVKPLLGSISWGVAYGLANLSMQFGAPSLRVVHEPAPEIRVARKGKGRSVSIKNIRRCANRRQVSVSGRWDLWIRYAHWRIVRSGVCLASGKSSMKKMRPAILDLQGQRLLGLNINPENGATRFEFDLDTILEVRREHRTSMNELWFLHGPDGYERSVGGNGTFRRGRPKWGASLGETAKRRKKR